MYYLEGECKLSANIGIMTKPVPGAIMRKMGTGGMRGVRKRNI